MEKSNPIFPYSTTENIFYGRGTENKPAYPIIIQFNGAFFGKVDENSLILIRQKYALLYLRLKSAIMFEGNGSVTQIKNAIEVFSNAFGNSKSYNTFLTPASLILLGDHTHYNEGILVSAALNAYTIIVIRKRGDKEVLLKRNSNPVVTFTFGQITGEAEIKCQHFTGIVRLLIERHGLNSGFECYIHNNIPECIGLGGTAAQEFGFASALNKIFSLKIDVKSLINLIRENELKVIGKISNIAHLYTCKFEKERHFFSIDLRSFAYKSFTYNGSEVDLVVIDTGEQIVNVQNICKERIEECEVGVKGLRLYIWGIKNLRDVGHEFLLKHYHMLPRRIFSRILYNVNERKRAEEAIKALKKNSVEELGRLITESHKSIAQDYELSGPQCDFLVDRSIQMPGVLGAKMISCSPKRATFHLVRSEHTHNFIKQIKKAYFEEYKKEIDIYPFHIADGAREITRKILLTETV